MKGKVYKTMSLKCMIADQDKPLKTIEYSLVIKCIKLIINIYKNNHLKKRIMKYSKLEAAHRMIKRRMIIK